MPVGGDRGAGDRHEIDDFAHTRLGQKTGDEDGGVRVVELLPGEGVDRGPGAKCPPRSLSNSEPKILGESKRGAQNQSIVPSVLNECRRLQVADEAVIGNEWVARHLSSIHNARCDHALPCTSRETSPRKVIGGRLPRGTMLRWLKLTCPSRIEQPATGTRFPSPRPVHLQFRRLEHERDDHRHERGPGYHRSGHSDRDHHLPLGDGSAHDPWRQVDRPLRPEAALHARTHRLCRGCRAERSRSRLGSADHWQLHSGGWARRC